MLLNHGREDEARRLIGELAGNAPAQDAVGAGILAQRLRNHRLAHQCFERAGETIQTDRRALHEFATTKMRLAQDACHHQMRGWREVNKRLLGEARGLLERVVRMEASPARHAWAWRDLARTLGWLRAPAGDVEAAFKRAVGLMPREPRFARELEQFRERRRKRSRRPARNGANGRRKRHRDTREDRS